MSQNKGFEKIGPILNKVIKKIGLKQRIKEETVLLIWKDVVDKTLSRHTKPSYIHRGILFVEIDSPIWSNEVSLLKEEIIKGLNKRVGEDIVKKICFRFREW